MPRDDRKILRVIPFQVDVTVHARQRRNVIGYDFEAIASAIVGNSLILFRAQPSPSFSHADGLKPVQLAVYVEADSIVAHLDNANRTTREPMERKEETTRQLALIRQMADQIGNRVLWELAGWANISFVDEESGFLIQATDRYGLQWEKRTRYSEVTLAGMSFDFGYLGAVAEALHIAKGDLPTLSTLLAGSGWRRVEPRNI